MGWNCARTFQIEINCTCNNYKELTHMDFSEGPLLVAQKSSRPGQVPDNYLILKGVYTCFHEPQASTDVV
jgi:hypothetical protein